MIKSGKKARSRSRQEKDVDALAKKCLILLRGEACERCGKLPVFSSHILPKGKHKRMRWMLENILLLCYACHMHFWHKHPHAAVAWFDEKFPGRYENLQIWTRQMPPIDLKEIRIGLEMQLKELS